MGDVIEIGESASQNGMETASLAGSEDATRVSVDEYVGTMSPSKFR